jgi:FkbM family methyltransferase
VRLKVFLSNLKLKDKLIYLFFQLFFKFFKNSSCYQRYNFLNYQRNIFFKIYQDGNNLVFKKQFIEIIDKNLKILLRKDTSDLYVYEQIFIQKEYLFILKYFILNSITLNCVIDAGANIGLTTLFFNNFFPATTFICVEPDEDNFEILKLNTSSYRNVICYKNALWYDRSKLVITNNFRDKLHWSKKVESIHLKELIHESSNYVNGITINDILSNNNFSKIDFLKMDIEGSEKFLLDPNCDLGFLKFVNVISIEVHEEVVSKNEIIKLLKKYDFLVFESGELLVGFK